MIYGSDLNLIDNSYTPQNIEFVDVTSYSFQFFIKL